MIKLSTRGRYGVRVMLDLAIHDDQGLTSLKEIAGRQEISEKYVWHMLGTLKASGLIHSVRGSRGGYRLARPAADIRLSDIVSVMEGDTSIVDCVMAPAVCSRASLCVARDVWCRISRRIDDTLRSITLKKMVSMHMKKIRKNKEARYAQDN